ncbi:MAG: hypothetical protein U1E14_01190 [Geminicoccaceae bacterium]
MAEEVAVRVVADFPQPVELRHDTGVLVRLAAGAAVRADKPKSAAGYVEALDVRLAVGAAGKIGHKLGQGKQAVTLPPAFAGALEAKDGRVLVVGQKQVPAVGGDGRQVLAPVLLLIRKLRPEFENDRHWPHRNHPALTMAVSMRSPPARDYAKGHVTPAGAPCPRAR